MAFTTSLRDAIIADLVASGEFAVGQVFKEPEDVEKTSPPCVFVIPGGGGQTDPNAFSTERVGDSTQEFTLQLVVKSSTPHTTVMDLLDAVRNEIEVKASNTNSVSNVDYADVSEWEEVFVTTSDMRNQLAVLQCTVFIAYKYAKGTL